MGWFKKIINKIVYQDPFERMAADALDNLNSKFNSPTKSNTPRFDMTALKNGPGSVGETSRTIAQAYMNLGKAESVSESFELLYYYQANLNRAFPTEGDHLQGLDYYRFKNGITMKMPYGRREESLDLALFVFQIQYYEALWFREGFNKLNQNEKLMILEVIYDSVQTIAPKGVVLTKAEFIDKGMNPKYFFGF